MVRLRKPLRVWVQQHVERHSRKLPSVALIVISLLLAGTQFLPVSFLAQGALAAPTGPKPSMQKTSFTLDGVTVTVNTPFLPGPFTASKPGDDTQTAVAATKDPNVHPFSAFYVTAVPYGSKPRGESVPKAKAGGVQMYRTSLHQYRANAGQHPQPGPTISLFGQQIQGEASLMLPTDPEASASTVVIEWVAEAGPRLWIVRITQEQAVGVTTLAPAQPFLTSLSYVKLSSTTLAQHSTVNVAQVAVAPNTPFPSLDQSPPWWGTSTCDSAWYNSQSFIQSLGPNYYAQQLGTGSYHAVIACKPRPAFDFPSCNSSNNYCDERRDFGVGGVQVNEWECVELSLRYLYMAYHQSPYGANGKDIVNNYPGSLNKIPNNGTTGQSPQAGDVLSFLDLALQNGTWVTTNGPGHTSLVISTNYTSTGNGTILTLGQNDTTNGLRTLTVSNGVIQDVTWSNPSGGLRAINWLHDPSSGGSSSPNAVHTVAGDFNGDGKTDVVSFYNYGNKQIKAWLWYGTTASTWSVTGPVWDSGVNFWDWNSVTFVAGDFDGDGKTDIMAIHDEGSARITAWLFKGTASGLAAPVQVLDSGVGNFVWSNAKFVAGDFNGDGKADLLAFYNLGSAQTTVFLWPGTATGLGTVSTVWTSAVGGFDWNQIKLVAGDFNGDGKADVVAVYNNGSAQTTFWFWPGTTSGLGSPSAVWSSSVGGFDWTKATFVAGDFNGDGKADVVAFYDYGSAHTEAWLWPGTTASTWSVAAGPAWDGGVNNWDSNKAKYVAGDFDGDGRADVVGFYNYGSAQTGATLWSGTTTSTLSVTGTVWTSAVGGWDWNNM